ncbi:MAG: excinuclease ABC subunit UvrC [Akkermansiaceae bacterium]|nr:excinuclease ABC subunit UvrC [Akkermansiaceae bacterium]
MSHLPALRARLSKVSHQPGVYLMMDRLGSIIYVGKAKDLRRRLSSYFMPSGKKRADRKTRALIDSICDFETHEVRNEQEALLLEGKLIKQYRPRYNVSFMDDKRFLLAKVNLEDPWPRFSTTRLKKADGACYFGPFAHSGAIKATVAWLNREFGVRSCRPRIPGEQDYKHCNADIIRNCSAPCIAKITREDYLEKIEEACELLSGKGKRVRLKSLREDMAKAAERLDFEKAARLRDVIANIERALIPTRQFSRGRGVPTTVKPVEDLAELGEWLNMPTPTVMECFDISNISNTHIVASMVRFREGLPDNQNYRRYRIKTVEGQDDFASMAEVVRRRYGRILQENMTANPEVASDTQEPAVEVLRRLAREGKSPITLPDLVIVDGGKGQLSAAVAELQRLGLHGLPIVGLAKQREEIFKPGESEPITIPHDLGALKLMQRIRDEAHRFANGYNELLLRKRVKESQLDDCPGISPAKKKLLLKKFGSVKRLMKATPEQIGEIPGISTKFAETLLEFLRRA